MVFVSKQKLSYFPKNALQLYTRFQARPRRLKRGNHKLLVSNSSPFCELDAGSFFIHISRKECDENTQVIGGDKRRATIVLLSNPTSMNLRGSKRTEGPIIAFATLNIMVDDGCK